MVQAPQGLKGVPDQTIILDRRQLLGRRADGYNNDHCGCDWNSPGLCSRQDATPHAWPKALSLEELTSRVGQNNKCGGGILPRPAGVFNPKYTSNDCDGDCCGYFVQSDDGRIREFGCEFVESTN